MNRKVKENVTVFLVLITIFMILGIALYVEGCDPNIKKECSGYTYVDAHVYDYSLQQNICCLENLVNNTCPMHSQYLCFSSYVIFNFTRGEYNDSCKVEVDNDNKDSFNAMADAKAKYRLNKIYNFYVKDDTNTCFNVDSLEYKAIGGFIFILFSIGIALWMILYLIKQYREQRKKHIVHNLYNNSYFVPMYEEPVKITSIPIWNPYTQMHKPEVIKPTAPPKYDVVLPPPPAYSNV